MTTSHDEEIKTPIASDYDFKYPQIFMVPSESNNNINNEKIKDEIKVDDTSIVSDYKSPEIFINKTIELNDDDMTLKSHNLEDINFDEVDANKSFFLIRDFLFFIFYWICLLCTISFDIWSNRLIWFILYCLSLIIGLLCHIYYRSPPFYSKYNKYNKYFEKSAVEYIKQWNGMELWDGRKSQLTSNEFLRRIELKLCYIETFGALNESNFGSIDIPIKWVNDESNDLINNLMKYKNKLIRLRIFHILTFNDKKSHNEFVTILKNKKNELTQTKTSEQLFHIEYNIEIQERLLMNTTNNNKNGNNLWNNCCSNRKISYICYIFGCGFFYRLYHDYYVKTEMYHCIKEVTL